MKRIAMLMTALALVVTGCQKGQKFTISGELAAAGLPEDAESVQLVSEGLPQPLTAEVRDGAFTFEGRVQKPALAKLVSNSPNQKKFPALILQKGDITFADGHPAGTKLNDADKAFIDQLKSIRKEHAGNRDELIKATEEAYFAFVADHKKDPCAVFAILLADNRLAPESVLKLIASASPEVQNVGEVRTLSARMKHKMDQ